MNLSFGQIRTSENLRGNTAQDLWVSLYCPCLTLSGTMGNADEHDCAFGQMTAAIQKLLTKTKQPST